MHRTCETEEMTDYYDWEKPGKSLRNTLKAGEEIGDRGTAKGVPDRVQLSWLRLIFCRNDTLFRFLMFFQLEPHHLLLQEFDLARKAGNCTVHHLCNFLAGFR